MTAKILFFFTVFFYIISFTFDTPSAKNAKVINSPVKLFLLLLKLGSWFLGPISSIDVFEGSRRN